MAMTIAPYYRLYELPWSPTEEVEARFRKVVRNALILFLIFAIIIPFIPLPTQPKVKTPDIPERIVKLLIEKKPPPPPPPKVEKPKEEPKPVEKPPEPKPLPTAREKAEKAMKKLQDQFADLRDNSVVEKAAMTKNLTGKIDEQTRSERALITSKVGSSSGGINTASLSRGYGGGQGSLNGHDTTQVTSAILNAKGQGGDVRRGQGATKAARSREEIELVFDRNKGAIYALYSRALRDKPELKGKVVVELTIAPDGEITKCSIVSSELNDPDLERKLIARIKLFRFETRDVETITTTKPIDFFPA